MKYQQISQVSKAFGETNDCAVKALSITTGLDYGTAHKLMAQAGREDGRGVDLDTIEEAIYRAGFDYIEIELESILAQCKFKKPRRSVTLTQVPTHPQAWQGTYMVFTKRHVSAVVNGQVEDWADGRQKRAWKVWKIVKKS